MPFKIKDWSRRLEILKLEAWSLKCIVASSIVLIICIEWYFYVGNGEEIRDRDKRNGSVGSVGLVRQI